MYEKILSGEDFSSNKNIVRTIAPITVDTVDKVLEGM